MNQPRQLKKETEIKKAAKQQKQPGTVGGKRPGAGRKPTGRVIVGLRLTPENRAWLESQAVGCSMSDVINRVIEGQR